MARIRQIRDVLLVRQSEERDRALTYKEIEVRAVTGAIHSAAGNRRGAAAAQKFRFHAAKAVEISTAKATQMFPVDTAAGLITQEQIAAEVAKRRAAQ